MILTYLPLCHVAERIFSTWTMVGPGPVLNFAESIETVNENLREVQPTLFFAVPRIWEKLHATVLIKANDATWFKRAVFRFGLGLAGRIGAIKVANGGEHTLSSAPAVRHRLADRVPADARAARPAPLPVRRLAARRRSRPRCSSSSSGSACPSSSSTA